MAFPVRHVFTIVATLISAWMNCLRPMKKLLPSHLPETEFSGTSRACGHQYGETNAEGIRALFLMETKPNRWRLEFARRCERKLVAWEPGIADFVRGMAEGSGLSLTETTLLLLHEE